MADTATYSNPETQIVRSLAIYRSDIDRLSQVLLADWWCQEQVQDYGLTLDAPVVAQALLNVLESHLEAMLKSWQAGDWLWGDLGTALQAEMERLAGI
jgi:hypothetical protein